MLTTIKRIPSAAQVLAELPLTGEAAKRKALRDIEIKRILSGADKRLLVICGPCSVDDPDSALEYCERLSAPARKLADRLLILPRLFTFKPRTLGKGFKGLAMQPDVTGGVDIGKGIAAARGLHLRVLTETGMPAADEILYPEFFPYFEDILGYAVIGARSSENAQHRHIAGAADIPVGIKNSPGGSLSSLAASVYAAQSGAEFFLSGYQVASGGNPFAHAVLRGVTGEDGAHRPNCDPESVDALTKRLERLGVSNPAVMIDTNHGNSGKCAARQADAALAVMSEIKRKEYRCVRGFMIESYLLGGRQDTPRTRGKSLTDECLSFKDTEKLLYTIAEKY